MALLPARMSRNMLGSLIAGLCIASIVGYSAWDYFKPATVLTRIGPYRFVLPKGYSIVADKGIDSYVGRITNGITTIYFDYGYYSDPLLLTPEEYVHSYKWKMDAAATTAEEDLSFEEEKPVPDLSRFEVRKVFFDTTRNGWFAVCRMDTLNITYRIPLPVVYEEYETITADSNARDYVKVVIPVDAQKNYTGMYLRDKEQDGAALSLVAHRLSENQKQEVLTIFNGISKEMP